MKNKELFKAWHKLRPDETARQRILACVLDEANKDKQKKEAFRMKKLAAVTCGILLLLAAAAFTGYKVYDLLKGGNPAIARALEFGYVQDVDMDSVYSDGVGVKLDKLMMDNGTMAVLFNFDFSGMPDRLKDIEFTSLSILGTLRIEDEQGRVIFEEGNPLSLAAGAIYDDGQRNREGKNHMVEGDTVQYVLFFTSYTGEFPKSERLTFCWSQILLHNDQQQEVLPEIKELLSKPENRTPEQRAHDEAFGFDPDIGRGIAKLFLGEWEVHVEVAQTFFQRASMAYEGSSDDISAKGVLTPTGFVMEIRLAYEVSSETAEALGQNVRLTDSADRDYEISDGYSISNESGSSETLINCLFPLSLYDGSQESFILKVNDQGIEKTIELRQGSH